MNTIVVRDADVVGAAAADLFELVLDEYPMAHFCLPTGESPLSLYRELVQREIDLCGAAVTKLDEWVGVPMDDEATCEHFLWRHLLGPLDYPRDSYLGFNSMAEIPEAECRRVAEAFEERGTIGMCVLGLGMNGHLGLIEPSHALERHAHVAILTESSRSHSMLAHLSTPPTHGMTMGIEDLFQFQRILLIVTGERKRAVFRRWRSQPVTTDFPASLLHLHPNLTIVCDEASIGQT